MCYNYYGDIMKDNIPNILEEYLLLFPEEKKRQEKLVNFLKDHTEKEFTDWNNFDGHIVASGFVYSKKDDKFLVLYHRDFKIFIYPGGHVDDTDTSILNAAIRETKEETGLSDFNLFKFTENKNIPIDIDTHEIDYNERLNLPKHFHFDFRYLFIVNKISDVHVNPEESLSYKWVDIDEIRKIHGCELALRKIEKLISRKD